MSFVLVLALAFVLVLLATIAGFALLVRFLTRTSDEDSAMRFDPFAPPTQPHWFLEFFGWLRRHPPLLTYRRDRRGRFRKRDRR